MGLDIRLEDTRARYARMSSVSYDKLVQEGKAAHGIRLLFEFTTNTGRKGPLPSFTRTETGAPDEVVFLIIVGGLAAHPVIARGAQRVAVPGGSAADFVFV